MWLNARIRPRRPSDRHGDDEVSILGDSCLVDLTAFRVALRSSAGDNIGKQLTRYAGPLNYIAILAPYLVQAVKENLPADFSTSLPLIAHAF